MTTSKLYTKFCGSLINSCGSLVFFCFHLFWYDLRKKTNMAEMNLGVVVLRCGSLQLKFQTPQNKRNRLLNLQSLILLPETLLWCSLPNINCRVMYSSNLKNTNYDHFKTLHEICGSIINSCGSLFFLFSFVLV